jgi:hypothetical protein
VRRSAGRLVFPAPAAPAAEGHWGLVPETRRRAAFPDQRHLDQANLGSMACRRQVLRRRSMYPSLVNPLAGFEYSLRRSVQHLGSLFRPFTQEAVEALIGVSIFDHALPTAADPRPEPLRRQVFKEVQ